MKGMNVMKKVYCLYRGSNKEIKEQKRACCAYVKLLGWTVSKEFCEDGNIYYDKMDSLMLIRDEVLKQKVDILLVYDFNNISNDEMEIPFAASWFVDNGIHVVSVKNKKRDFKKERGEILNKFGIYIN